VLVELKKIVFLTFVSVLLLSMVVVSSFPISVEARPGEIVVPDDYTRIQWAIGNATDGDTILVRAGTYYEHVVVNKSVALIGENERRTIVDGNGTGTVIKVTANNVKITRFTAQNSGLPDSGIRLDYSSGNNISHNIMKNNWAGIELFYSNNNVLTGNNVTNNGNGIYFIDVSSNNVLNGNLVSSNNGYGISLSLAGSNNTLAGNLVSSNNYIGVFFGGSCNNTLVGNIVSNNRIGIDLSVSSDNVLAGNIVSSNNEIGISFQASSDNVLTGNTVSSNNGTGIGLHASSNNVLAGNNVTNNGYGIYFGNNITIHGYGIALSSCENNTIYHNNFIDNFIDNKSQVWNFVSTNFWDHGGEGNYWSDYEGVDHDGDGIGNSPYVIDEENRDNHPLMSPWTPTWRPTPLWMRWWFWTIVAAGIAALAGAIYFRKKRKPPTPTAPPPLDKTTTHL